MMIVFNLGIEANQFNDINYIIIPSLSILELANFT